jgi:hypothetical protein
MFLGVLLLGLFVASSCFWAFRSLILVSNVLVPGILVPGYLVLGVLVLGVADIRSHGSPGSFEQSRQSEAAQRPLTVPSLVACLRVVAGCFKGVL